MRVHDRKKIFIGILALSLVAFEIFNFASNEYGLKEFLGNLNVFGLSWSVLIAIAFCGADFAGMARVFTPQTGKDEPKEVYLIMAAWLFAAVLNALLTWWSIAEAMTATGVHGNALVSQGVLITWVPALIACMVWLLRVLLVASLSMSIDQAMHSKVAKPVMPVGNVSPQSR